MSDDKRPLIASISRVTSELGCEFVADETYPDWYIAEPGTDIEKGWKVRNNGTIALSFADSSNQLEKFLI